MQAAFSLVDRGEFNVIFFQATAVGFYGKLSTRTVRNNFINYHTDPPEINPWWEKYVMIYPESYPWPEGDIDLNGPAF